MDTHLFNVNIAKEYGVHEAIMLYNLMFWQEKNEAENRHLYEDRHWTYNSVKAFDTLFIYFSRNQIRRILDKLETEGLILCGNFNKSGYDRTKWYSVTDFAKHKCIWQKPQMELAQNTNRFGENNEPIPDVNTDSNTDNNTANMDLIAKSNTIIILDYLNEKTGKNFRVAPSLLARFKDGYTVDDVKKVIDIKYKQWSHKADMRVYLRPSTLFSEKFDSYLNEGGSDKQVQDDFLAQLIRENNGGC